MRNFFDVLPQEENENLKNFFARFIYANRLPFRIVENEHLLKFFKAMRPSFKVLSRHDLSKPLLDAEYDEVKKSTFEVLTSSDCLTIVIDGWSNVRRNSIINIVICTPKPYFFKSIDSKEGRHTAFYLSKIVEDIIISLGSEKIIGIISDNARNMKSKGKIIIQKYGHISCYGCGAYTLNLLIQDLCKIDFVKRILKQTKSIVVEITFSNILLAKFRDQMAQNVGFSVGNSVFLSLPIITR